MAPDVNLRTVARGTPGFSGADLANIVNEAALLAARKNKRIVTLDEFEEARDKVLMGAEKKSMVQTEEDKKLTAYHEGGHALVNIHHAEADDPIHKATILPRGQALGMVMTLPERDKPSRSREYYKARIAMAMGGRVAEEIIFGYDKVTTGASQDIKSATATAKHMVTEAGMSDLLGPLSYGDNQDEVFLGRSVSRNQQMSEDTQRKVDAEVKKLVDEGYEKAKKILNEKIEDLHKLKKNLLIYETLTGDEIRDLILRDIPVSKKEDTEVVEKDKTSSLGSMGLKPKIVH
jgi:cell division protease FtsH